MRRTVLSQIALAAVALAAVVLAACAGEPDTALRVGDASFERSRIEGLSAEQRELLADLAGLGTLVSRAELDSLVLPLARREAHRSRLGALPYQLAAAATIGEDSLRSLYARDPEWELSVQHVVRLVPAWAGDSARAAELAVAREAERRARRGENFASLASELSQEPGAAERGGMLEPGREGSWVDPFWDAALELRPGEISPVVETEYGYHVLRLDGRSPVPFAEADRLALLRRLVTPAAARVAMERWVATRPPVVLDPPAVLAARRAIRSGTAPDTLVIARSPSGDVFDAMDLALAWAALGSGERRALDEADDAGFGAWVENEVRERFWADEARRLGAEPPRGAEASARAAWTARLGGYAESLGFAPEMSGDEVAGAALRALNATGQEALIARAELPALRPLLRALYPATAASATSSEIRSSGSSR